MTAVSFADLRAAGRCASCCVPHAGPGVYCPRCVEQRKVSWRRRYAALRASGRCTDCKVRYTAKGRSRCTDCAAVARQRHRARDAQRRAAGICIHCGKRPIAAGGRCTPCREAMKEVPSAGTNATREARRGRTLHRLRRERGGRRAGLLRRLPGDGGGEAEGPARRQGCRGGLHEVRQGEAPARAAECRRCLAARRVREKANTVQRRERREAEAEAA